MVKDYFNLIKIFYSNLENVIILNIYVILKKNKKKLLVKSVVKVYATNLYSFLKKTNLYLKINNFLI